MSDLTYDEDEIDRQDAAKYLVDSLEHYVTQDTIMKTRMIEIEQELSRVEEINRELEASRRNDQLENKIEDLQDIIIEISSQENVKRYVCLRIFS